MDLYPFLDAFLHFKPQTTVYITTNCKETTDNGISRGDDFSYDMLGLILKFRDLNLSSDDFSDDDDIGEEYYEDEDAHSCSSHGSCGVDLKPWGRREEFLAQEELKEAWKRYWKQSALDETDTSEDHQIGEAPSEFTCFNNLPPEIRCRIWRETLPGPRMVEMLFCQIRRSKAHEFITPCAGFPIALHVCLEARKEALRFFDLAFDNVACLRPTYFNFKIDTLHLRQETSDGKKMSLEQTVQTIRHIPEHDRNRIKRLSGSWSVYIKHPSSKNPFPPIICLFPSLTHMTIRQCLRVPGQRPQWHSGECKDKDHTRLGCFPENSTISRYPYFPREETAEQRLTKVKKMVASCLGRLRDGLKEKFWGDLEWQEPEVDYGMTCLYNMPDIDFYCARPIVGRPIWKEVQEDSNSDSDSDSDDE